jgi:hypothetical protein
MVAPRSPTDFALLTSRIVKDTAQSVISDIMAAFYPVG